MTSPPLHALHVFATVARSDSFRSAADELCVSQSAVSHQIKHLEEWFGSPLFDRSGHRPRLLPHAETLARALGASFADVDAACRRARAGSERRTLVIATIPSMAICWLIPRLSGFTAGHPDNDIRVIYAFHGREIDFGDVDIAFVYARTPPGRPGATVLPFMSGTSAPVCSPSLCTAAKNPGDPEEILRAGLLHDTDVSAWREWLLLAGRSPPEPMSGPIFEDFNLLRAASLAGQGVALCPLALIGDDLAEGRLIRLSDITVNRDFSYYLVVRDAANEAAANASEAFTRWLVDLRDADRRDNEPPSVAMNPTSVAVGRLDRGHPDDTARAERMPDEDSATS